MHRSVRAENLDRSVEGLADQTADGMIHKPLGFVAELARVWIELGWRAEHGIVAMALPRQDPVHKISIIPRGIGALGYTIQRPTEDRFLMTKEELDNRMARCRPRAASPIMLPH
jgi:Peptidase family M41